MMPPVTPAWRGLLAATLLTVVSWSSAQETTGRDATFDAILTAAHAGDFVKARALVQQAVTADPRNPQYRYAFAVIEALVAKQEIAVAYTALDQARTLGFAPPPNAAADPDLAVLRADPRFASFFGDTTAAPAAPATPLAAAPAATAATRPKPAHSLRPADAAARPAEATFRDGRPVGLYFMTRYWSYTHTLEKAAWYFAPDGTVYENLQTGFSPADLATHRGNKGTAKLVGSDLAITWSNGETERSSLERDKDGGGFAWDMGLFTPVKPIASPATLAGTYGGGESVAHGGNQVAVSKTLQLNADGTFRWDGISFAAGSTGTDTLYAGSSGATTGTWKSDSYALTLTDTTGAVFRGIAFPFDMGAGTPDHLFFAGIMYQRQ